MTEHAKHKTETKKEHKSTTHKTHAKKEHSTTAHKKPATHKKAPVTKTEPQNQTATIVTTAIVTAIIVLALFFGIQFFISSAPSWGSGDADTKYAAVDGQVVITEWSDFECPFCARAQPALAQVKETYGDAVIIEYKHFPLSFHADAEKAAQASECARDQGKFWEYHDVLFANQNALDFASLKGYASNLGLDTATFNSCLDSGEKAGIVAKDMAEGQAFGVSGTPTFKVAGEKLVGALPFSEFKTAIDKALAAGASDYVAPVPKDDPIIEFTVIEEPDCASCDTEQVVSYTKSELFPTAVVTTLTKTDARAIKLIEELQLNALPAYIFSENVEEAANYAQVEQAFMKVGDKYIINPSATGNVQFITEPDVTGRPVKGDMDAPVTIIEWSDFECPYCERFYSETYQEIVDTYVNNGDVKIIFMHFPLSFHASAENAAVASECANEQGQFWEYHDALFENQQSLDTGSLKGYATDLGLDMESFNTCYAARESVADINAQMALGQSYGISGTPGFLINGVSVSGAQPFDVFEQIIEAELGN